MRDIPIIQPTPAPDFERIDLRLPKVPFMMIDTPRGQIAADEVPGLLTLDFKRPNGKTTVGILVYRLLPSVGMLCQMDAATARKTGQSLITLADQIDIEAAVKGAVEDGVLAGMQGVAEAAVMTAAAKQAEK